MPWTETCCMDERVRFVTAARTGWWSVSELCREYGISRKTGYKWLRRADAEGLSSLADRSRARHSQEHRIPDDVRDALLKLRRRRPNRGPKKLLVELRRQLPDARLPSLSLASEIIRQAGLAKPVKKRRRLKHGTGGLGGDDVPNGVWATDYKGQHRLKSKSYCYPLTVSDSCSRFLLACRAHRQISGMYSMLVFRNLFRTHGVPEHIRSDNGVPFASTGAGRLTDLSVFWIDQGIKLQRITPGRPQQNGRHERIHRTLKESTLMPLAATLTAQQRRYDRFRDEYNFDRPSEALEMQCPGDVYEPSSRAYVEDPPDPEYPSEYLVRRVQKNGSIKLMGKRIFISECLRRRDVGLLEIDDGHWRVYYRHHPVGAVDTTAKNVRIRDMWDAGATAPQAR